MRYFTFSLLIILFVQHTHAQCKKKYIDKEIIGFYASWQFYDRDKLAKPANIDFRRFTTVIYSFFEPTEDGHIRGGDQFVDETVLKGEINWATSTEEEHTFFETSSLPYLAHLKKTKVLISLGGWTYSKHFSRIAHTEEYRKTFTKECVRLIEEYNIDGVDIDWEFPGYSGRSSDKEQFTILLKDLRAAFDAHSLKTKKQYYISVTLNTAPPHNKFLAGDSIGKYSDMINLMCYDFYGSWVPTTTHKAALYTYTDPNLPNTVLSADSLFKIATDELKMPSNKINLGCSFNGRVAHYRNENPLFSSASLSITYLPKTQGSPLYYLIEPLTHNLLNEYDTIAEAPYLVDTTQQMFITYENERSLIAKANYVTQQGAMGLFIWDITGDMIETKPGSGIIKDTPLLYAVHEGFCREEEIKKERKKRKK